MLGHQTNVLAGTVNTIKKDIEDICQSGKFYVTEEIGKQFKTIVNGLDYLKLDGSLMTTSEDWQKGFDSTQIAQHNKNAQNVLDSLASVLFDYKSMMENTAIASNQENEIREKHHLALNNLENMEKELLPFTHGAVDRIQQFGDHIGVTDRYTGYRNNLTRGSRVPFKLETSWMDKNIQDGFLRSSINRSNAFAAPEQRSFSAAPSHPTIRFGTTQPDKVDTKGYQTVDSIYPRSNTMFADNGALMQRPALSNLKAVNAMNASSANAPKFVAMPKGHKNMSEQEQAGINTIYPGKTEYMIRYQTPQTNARVSDFIINPTPNLKLHGRPLGSTTYMPSFTEYQTRFEWPDSNKIVKLPWKRH